MLRFNALLLCVGFLTIAVNATEEAKWTLGCQPNYPYLSNLDAVSQQNLITVPIISGKKNILNENESVPCGLKCSYNLHKFVKFIMTIANLTMPAIAITNINVIFLVVGGHFILRGSKYFLVSLVALVINAYFMYHCFIEGAGENNIKVPRNVLQSVLVLLIPGMFECVRLQTHTLQFNETAKDDMIKILANFGTDEMINIVNQNWKNQPSKKQRIEMTLKEWMSVPTTSTFFKPELKRFETFEKASQYVLNVINWFNFILPSFLSLNFFISLLSLDLFATEAESILLLFVANVYSLTQFETAWSWYLALSFVVLVLWEAFMKKIYAAGNIFFEN